MKKLLLVAALLLAGTAAGSAFAPTHDGGDPVRPLFDHADGRAAADRATFRVADDHRRDGERHRRDGERHRDRHDDDDDDDDGARGVGRMPATGPTDPATPVPANGLFQGKARPKVEVN